MGDSTVIDPPLVGPPALVRGGGRGGIAAFVALAYLLSWIWLLPIAAAGGRVAAGRGWPTHFPALVAPAVAAIAVTAWSEGSAGLADLGRRMVRVRVPLRRWLFAVTPLLVLGVVLVVDRVSGRALPAAAEFARFSGLPAG